MFTESLPGTRQPTKTGKPGDAYDEPASLANMVYLDTFKKFSHTLPPLAKGPGVVTENGKNRRVK